MVRMGFQVLSELRLSADYWSAALWKFPRERTKGGRTAEETGVTQVCSVKAQNRAEARRKPHAAGDRGDDAILSLQ